MLGTTKCRCLICRWHYFNQDHEFLFHIYGVKTCPVCLESFVWKDPVKISCSHVVCLACIDITGTKLSYTRVIFLRTGSLQTKLNAGLSEQQQEDLFQNERSFHCENSTRARNSLNLHGLRQMHLT